MYCSQAHLVDRFPELLLPSDIESVLIMLATPSLRTCLAEKDEAPLVATEVLHHTLRILRRYCAAVTRLAKISPLCSCLMYFRVLFLTPGERSLVYVLEMTGCNDQVLTTSAVTSRSSHNPMFVLCRNDEIPQVSVNFALSVLSLGTRLKSDGSFPEASSNTSLESAVTGSLFVLEITSSSK